MTTAMIQEYTSLKQLRDGISESVKSSDKLINLSIADFAVNVVLQVASVGMAVTLLVLAVFTGGATAFQAAMAILTGVLSGVSCWLI